MRNMREEKMIVCPRCKKEVTARYREKPKGEIAQFVCWDCLPDDMKPDLDTVLVAEDLAGVLDFDKIGEEGI